MVSYNSEDNLSHLKGVHQGDLPNNHPFVGFHLNRHLRLPQALVLGTSINASQELLPSNRTVQNTHAKLCNHSRFSIWTHPVALIKGATRMVTGQPLIKKPTIHLYIHSSIYNNSGETLMFVYIKHQTPCILFPSLQHPKHISINLKENFLPTNPPLPKKTKQCNGISQGSHKHQQKKNTSVPVSKCGINQCSKFLPTENRQAGLYVQRPHHQVSPCHYIVLLFLFL